MTCKEKIEKIELICEKCRTTKRWNCDICVYGNFRKCNDEELDQMVNYAEEKGEGKLWSWNREDKVLEEEGVAPYCPNCGSGEYLHNPDINRNKYCGQCGTKLDWSDIEDNYDSINYGFVPKVKITEEDKKIGNVTFKKGVHIYFCGHCNQGILPSWKHCAHCGEKIVWKDKRNLKQ